MLMASYNVFTLQGKILMLALDHRGSFNKLINPKEPETVNQQVAVEIKRQIIAALYDDFSGVLVDSVVGLPAYKQVVQLQKKQKPFLLCAEKTGYESEGESRRTELQYSVFELKDLGASGVKLLLYYHPQASTKEHQLKIAKQVLQDCQAANLPLFLELVTYPLANFNSHKPELVLDSVYDFLQAEIVPDVFKLEFPGDPAACFQITKLLKKTPWILLTKGDSFYNFRDQLKVAVANGAVGFLAGRALWQDFNQYPVAKRRDFFQTIVRQRFAEIVEIVLEA